MPEICRFSIPGLAPAPASNVIVTKVNQYVFETLAIRQGVSFLWSSI